METLRAQNQRLLQYDESERQSKIGSTEAASLDSMRQRLLAQQRQLHSIGNIDAVT